MAVSEFTICSTTNVLKCYITFQLVFGRDFIVPIKNTVDCELIRHQNQTQVNKNNIHKNRNQVYHDYNVGDTVILNNQAAYKYEILYKGLFVITRCCTNGTATIKYGQIQIRHNIFQIKPYVSDTNVEYFNPKNLCDAVNMLSPVI